MNNKFQNVLRQTDLYNKYLTDKNKIRLSFASKKTKNTIGLQNKNVNQRVTNVKNKIYKMEEIEFENKLIAIALLSAIDSDTNNSRRDDMLSKRRHILIETIYNKTFPVYLYNMIKKIRALNNITTVEYDKMYQDLLSTPFILRAKRNFTTTFGADLIDQFLTFPFYKNRTTFYFQPAYAHSNTNSNNYNNGNNRIDNRLKIEHLISYFFLGQRNSNWDGSAIEKMAYHYLKKSTEMGTKNYSLRLNLIFKNQGIPLFDLENQNGLENILQNRQYMRKNLNNKGFNYHSATL
jgi:hypothetical protein